jgi:Protein of unknown function (DUF3108)
MPSFFKKLALTLACLSFIGSSFAGGNPTEPTESTSDLLKPYRVVYHASYDFFLPIEGSAIRQLQKQESGRWLLSHTVDSSVLTLKETSLFDWQQQQPKPQIYKLTKNSIGKKKDELLEFDWRKLQVHHKTNKPAGTLTIPANAFDKLTYQLKMRLDLLNNKEPAIYTVAEKRKLKEYRFIPLGSELLDTPVGKLETIKIKRDRGADSKRQTTLWLAKDWDYLLVKIQQQEKGKNYEVVMTEGELDGKPIKGT